MPEQKHPLLNNKWKALSSSPSLHVLPHLTFRGLCLWVILVSGNCFHMSPILRVAVTAQVPLMSTTCTAVGWLRTVAHQPPCNFQQNDFPPTHCCSRAMTSVDTKILNDKHIKKHTHHTPGRSSVGGGGGGVQNCYHQPVGVRVADGIGYTAQNSVACQQDWGRFISAPSTDMEDPLRPLCVSLSSLKSDPQAVSF